MRVTTAQELLDQLVAWEIPHRTKSHKPVFIPGAVSPLALIDDTQIEVEFWLGKGLAASEHMYFHPLDNSMTTEVTFKGLSMFLKKTGHTVNLLNFF